MVVVAVLSTILQRLKDGVFDAEILKATVIAFWGGSLAIVPWDLGQTLGIRLGTSKTPPFRAYFLNHLPGIAQERREKKVKEREITFSYMQLIRFQHTSLGTKAGMSPMAAGYFSCVFTGGFEGPVQYYGRNG
jgi:hypothetical protein